ncbi:unnamed protein product, partial [Ectocarpus sp. 12 AP-2014]
PFNNPKELEGGKGTVTSHEDPIATNTDECVERVVRAEVEEGQSRCQRYSCRETLFPTRGAYGKPIMAGMEQEHCCVALLSWSPSNYRCLLSQDMRPLRRALDMECRADHVERPVGTDFVQHGHI